MKANAVSKSNPWLYWFAVLTALATLALIGIGGLVTSHEAGMSVPDWPTTYGYNMFLFPINKWLGGIFYEHSHRLLASLVGLMTTILAVWLWLKDRRPWMAWLGVAAFLLVVAQGVLGGLRVTMHMDSLGIYHATIAQLFFVLTCAIALFTSRWWVNLQTGGADSSPGRSLAKPGPQPAAGAIGTSRPTKIGVQHHVAHVLSCMAENEIEPPVLGVSWDGTGYGLDGTIWGGEFFLVTDKDIERIAHFRPFRLPEIGRAHV